MSVSLVKKSLDLVSTENKASNEKPADTSRESKRKFKQKNKKIDSKKNAAILVQKLRESSKVNSPIDRVEVNVQKLLNLSKNNVLYRKKQTKLLRKISKTKKTCPKPESKPKTAFTEEDFAKFEKEYFAN